MDNEIPFEGHCDFCGRDGEKQTKEDLTKGITFLWPDLKWICERCLRFKAPLVGVSE